MALSIGGKEMKGIKSRSKHIIFTAALVLVLIFGSSAACLAQDSVKAGPNAGMKGVVLTADSNGSRADASEGDQQEVKETKAANETEAKSGNSVDYKILVLIVVVVIFIRVFCFRYAAGKR